MATPPPPAFDPAELLPAAAAWVAEQERFILAAGKPLSPQLLAFAREIGIKRPERVRLHAVYLIPRPADARLNQACEAMGMLHGAGGLCLGYGIYLNTLDQDDVGLIVHELVHVAQYERLGGIEGFLRTFMAQVLASGGYDGSPLEVEARTLAARLCGKGAAMSE